MALVTPDIYRRLTRDYDPEGGDINDAVDTAEEILETLLNRKLPSTIVVDELVKSYRRTDGTYSAFPKYLPVTAVSTVGWSITAEGYLISAPTGFSLVYGVSSINLGSRTFESEISYTGGWTDTTAPKVLQMAISKLAKNIIYQNSYSSGIPAGIKSASMGSVSVDINVEDDRYSDLVTDDVWDLAKGFRRNL